LTLKFTNFNFIFAYQLPAFENCKIIQPLVLTLTQKQIHSVCFKLLKNLVI